MGTASKVRYAREQTRYCRSELIFAWKEICRGPWAGKKRLWQLGSWLGLEGPLCIPCVALSLIPPLPKYPEK